MDSTKITVEANVSANIKKVWDYYTLPEHITKWNFASDDWQCPNAENDLKIGGTYKTRMEAKDGSFGFDFEAIYSEIIHEKKLSYGFGERNATVLFENLENNTHVIISFDPENQHPLEMQKNGWQAILNNFKKYTEDN